MTTLSELHRATLRGLRNGTDAAQAVLVQLHDQAQPVAVIGQELTPEGLLLYIAAKVDVVEPPQAGQPRPEPARTAGTVETTQEGPRLEASTEGQLLVAATGPVTADTAARTITGRLVPFGQVGSTNMGRFTFASGSIVLPADLSEVKLLVEHAQRESVGYLVEVDEKPDGLWGTFHVPPGDAEGDLALTRAANKVRDAFSVGVDLDASTLRKVYENRRTPERAVAASGALRETSLVSVPAFTGARVTDVAASARQLVEAAWSDLHHLPTTEGSPPMFCTHCGQAAHPAGTPCPVLQAAAALPAPGQVAPQLALGQVAPLAPGQNPAVTSEQLQAALLQLLGVPEAQAQANAPETPATVPAAAGAAGPAGTQVVAEPPTYTFDGRGHGFIRDAWQARMEGNADAAARINRFGQELAQGGAVIEQIVRASDPELMTAAVETRTTAPEVVQAEVYRGDQLIRAVDRGRPMFAKMRNVRLTDATPFKVPTEGEFDGVGPHAEGTAHVAEGTLTLGNVTVNPEAISGAYRFSRELADSSNPAIDGIALRAMMRDYRRGSEDMVAAALELLSDGVTARPFAAELIDTAQELRAQIIAHALANDAIPADFGFLGSTAYTLYANLEAADGRPYFPPLNPTNAAGTTNLRQLTMNVDGTPMAATVGPDADNGFLVNGEDVIVGESQILNFRFDQPEGPGIIKVALWGYQVAHVMRDAGVRRFSTADEA